MSSFCLALKSKWNVNKQNIVWLNRSMLLEGKLQMEPFNCLFTGSRLIQYTSNAAGLPKQLEASNFIMDPRKICFLSPLLWLKPSTMDALLFYIIQTEKFTLYITIKNEPFDSPLMRFEQSISWLPLWRHLNRSSRQLLRLRLKWRVIHFSS